MPCIFKNRTADSTDKLLKNSGFVQSSGKFQMFLARSENEAYSSVRRNGARR